MQKSVAATCFVAFLLAACLAVRADSFVLNTIDAAAGEAPSGWLKVPAGQDGDARIPVSVLQGVAPGPVLALVAGTQ